MSSGFPLPDGIPLFYFNKNLKGVNVMKKSTENRVHGWEKVSENKFKITVYGAGYKRKVVLQ